MNCQVCRRLIALSDLLHCATCKKNFHYQCLNMTTAKFSAIYPTKKTWKCELCTNVTTSRGKLIKQKTQGKNTVSAGMKNTDNITNITPKTQHLPITLPKSNSLEELCLGDLDRSSSFLDSTSRSLPHATPINNSLVQDLSEEITSLKMDLQSAHKEIINLNEENTQLKQEIQDLNKKVTLLMKISSSVTTSTPKKISTCSSSIQKSTKKKIAFEKAKSCENNAAVLVNTSSLNEVNEEASLNLLTKRQHSTKVNNTSSQVKAAPVPVKPANKQSIHILGDQSARGVALKLHNLRQNQGSNNFSVSAFVKSDDYCCNIIRDLRELIARISEKDIIVLILGTNEKSTTFISELEMVLHKNQKGNIFLCEIKDNPYINMNIVNKDLKFIMSRIRGGHFVELGNGLDISNKINIEIDYLDYKEKYIENFGKIIKTANSEKTKTGVKGTIPYFFKLQEMKNKQKARERISMIPAKGTIPYYFKKDPPLSTNALKKGKIFRA